MIDIRFSGSSHAVALRRYLHYASCFLFNRAKSGATPSSSSNQHIHNYLDILINKSERCPGLAPATYFYFKLLPVPIHGHNSLLSVVVTPSKLTPMHQHNKFSKPRKDDRMLRTARGGS